jgi:uncharacterized membrane protein YagU involved in acid resistance
MARMHILRFAEAEHAPHLKAAAFSGVIAGFFFALLMMILIPLFMGESAWTPVRMVAAIVMGERALESTTAAFDTSLAIVALFVHFALSILYAVILAYLIYRLETASALLVGALFGLTLYVINFYAFTGLFAWFAVGRNWISVVAHLTFGLMLAFAYKQLARREMPRQHRA